MESVEFKVEMVGIHEKRLRKSLSKIRGIEKVEVDANSQKVVVTGYAHRNKVLKAIRRSGLKADFWSAQNELLNVYASTATATYGSFLRFNNFNFF
ncbi:heavy metal-associated isoprenylated plant protein 28-like [Euphorbia lathyris]|uniref:heavy metal-associated isoprenylated plant protein 28-like n=1 Tax=Euphorbia lathyris TaxID=212925 RepID=UPI0033138C33